MKFLIRTFLRLKFLGKSNVTGNDMYEVICDCLEPIVEFFMMDFANLTASVDKKMGDVALSKTESDDGRKKVKTYWAKRKV